MADFESRFVDVDGIRTHYLAAGPAPGEAPDLLLLHSGEFGACAELSWEHNIAAFAPHFRILAPDWLGFGQTEKIFSFGDMWEFRIRHITAFLRTMGVTRTHAIGNSMGGTILLAVAAMQPRPWPLDRVIAVSGGGHIPENEARAILNSYDGSREHMRRIVETMFVNPAIRADQAYIDRRHLLSRQPGAWECTAAARFRAPWHEPSGMPRAPHYGAVDRPVLLVTGAQDALREPGFGARLQAEIPGAELRVVAHAGHCAQIDAPGEVNAVVLHFLQTDRRH